VSSHMRIKAGWKEINELKQGFVSGLHEALRRFSHFVKANKGWELAKNATEIANTTVDLTSGFGETDPRVVNLASTADLQFLITDLGLSDIEILIGPNDLQQYERGIVKDISYVTAGVSVTLQNALAYTYESADRVRTLEYFPSLSIGQPGHPLRETGEGWTLELVGEEF